MKKMNINITGYDITEKVVRPHGNAGSVYLPRKWIGKTVKIILLEDIKEEEIRV